MLLAIWVSSDDSSKSDSRLIYDETKEWTQTPILDITTVSDQSSCPSGYEQVNSEFYGTSDICINRIKGGYTIGDCGRNNRNTLRGVKKSEITNFEHNLICIKNGQINYHEIALTRPDLAKPL